MEQWQTVDLANVLNDSNFIASAEWHTINSKEVGFSISVEKEYYVYGLLQYHNQSRFLLMDDNNMPGFFPSILFDIRQGDIPIGWIVKKYEIREEDLIITTDPMLIDSYEDLKSIVEYKDAAIRAMLDYKQFVQEYGI